MPSKAEVEMYRYENVEVDILLYISTPGLGAL